MCVDALRDEGVAVGSAIGMPEAERAIALEVDEQLAAMDGSMVHKTLRGIMLVMPRAA